MKYGRNGGLIVEAEDQCDGCRKFDPENLTCSLIEALTSNLVHLAQPQILVENCAGFEPETEVDFLRLVK